MAGDVPCDLVRLDVIGTGVLRAGGVRVGRGRLASFLRGVSTGAAAGPAALDDTRASQQSGAYVAFPEPAPGGPYDPGAPCSAHGWEPSCGGAGVVYGGSGAQRRSGALSREQRMLLAGRLAGVKVKGGACAPLSGRGHPSQPT
jgi:hypothetical protein